MNIRRDAAKNTDLVQCAMPSARPWRAQARDHCACAREDPTRKAVRWQKFYVLQPSYSSASSTMSAACCWQSPSRRAKAPSARRTAPNELAYGRHACWLWPCGHFSRRLQGEGRVWHQCLTIQRAAAKLFAKAASELVSIVCRRVWRLSASLHRYRTRTRLWCIGDRMAKRRRGIVKPRVSNMGTISLKPFTQLYSTAVA